MPLFDTYTKRKRLAAQADKPAIWHYDSMPQAFRTQVMYIWVESLGGYREVGAYDFEGPPPSNARWELIARAVARERGVFSLSGQNDNALKQCGHQLMQGSVDDALEIIEATFRYIERVMPKVEEWQRREEGLKTAPGEAVVELNERFREHQMGYRYESGVIVRVDSELLYAEVTEPALHLLHVEGFDGPLDEFMRAHDHFRKREMADANVDALNALESTLKAICAARKWKYSSGATATDLVKLVVQKGLIPPQLQSQFEHLLKAMQTSLPPERHNFAGHGQGPEPVDVADHLAAYSLHLMAANIVLLIEAHRALK